ncbi:Hypothetical protein ACGLYG10_2047 [Actinomyces glycerinitolerans]|uniref:Histidine kinase n=1 Tax=Actinomyces glycerinitolerans TaxID=1892869 RepID=A0A1M4S0V7_9ACTO|nr:Hypothetical protein ACGLYG10_2047 [Actinomyces glycerinitolerans]
MYITSLLLQVLALMRRYPVDRSIGGSGMSLGKKITYATLGAGFLVFDASTWVGGRSAASTVVLTILTALGSVLLGWFPRFAGVLVVVCSMADEVLSAGVLLSSVVLQLVVVDWLSRRWDAAVVAVVAVHAMTGTVVANDSMAFMRAQAVLTAIAVIVGMALRQYEHRLVELAEREARLRLELENEELRVRSEIALTLHDSIATDLAQVVVAGQSLARDLPAGSEEDRARALVDAGQQAMTHLRGLMDGLRTPDSVTERKNIDLRAAVSECRRMLESRGVLFEAGSSVSWDVLLRDLDPPSQTLLVLALREGAVNALKYAPDGSTVVVEIDQIGDHINLEVSSARHTGGGQSATIEEMRRQGMSGSTGLSGLAMRAARLGGKVVYGPAGDRWLLGASVPVRLGAEPDGGADVRVGVESAGDTGGD